MSEMAQKIAETFDMLPEAEQKLAFELLRTLVLNWDPDFTKLTPEEARRLKEAESDEETFSMEDIMKELGISSEDLD